MSVSGHIETFSELAGADLSAQQYRVVQIGGTLATSNLNAAGVLQNKPQSGENATIAFSGYSKGIAGAALTKGLHCKVSSGGFFTSAVSGDTVTARSINAVSSGGVGEFLVGFLGYTLTYSAG